MNTEKRYLPEVREWTVWMVLDQQAEHGSQWAATAFVATKLGCTAETLLRWVRHAECDRGLRAGPKTEEHNRSKQLEREVMELCQVNELLRKASGYFAQAELGRRFRS